MYWMILIIGLVMADASTEKGFGKGKSERADFFIHVGVLKLFGTNAALLACVIMRECFEFFSCTVWFQRFVVQYGIPSIRNKSLPDGVGIARELRAAIQTVIKERRA
jgi:hypothetical protein